MHTLMKNKNDLHCVHRSFESIYHISLPVAHSAYCHPKKYQMSFEAEKIDKTGPTDLISEHHLLVDWVKKNPNRGGVENLDHRVIDKDGHVALYYISGIGMGHGQSFALVRGRNIFFFDAVNKRAQHPEVNTISKNVSQISVPENATLSQKEIERLIGSALAAYMNAYDFMWSLHGNTSVSFESTKWLVIPKKYSRLYWSERGTAWLNKQKLRATSLCNVLTSPFAALLLLSISLAFAMSDANNPSWIDGIGEFHEFEGTKLDRHSVRSLACPSTDAI